MMRHKGQALVSPPLIDGLTLLRRDLANHLIRNSMIYFMIALSLTGLAGCATIAGSTSYPVTINSSPSEAKFLVSNKSGQEVHSGTTPATVSLKSSAGFFSGEKYSIKYAKAGFNDGLSSVDSHISGWYYGNILFGGILGLLLIDPATGAMWALPNSVSTSLTKQSD